MQEGDIVKIDLLVEHSGNRKSKDAWSRIKKDFEELAQQTHNSAMAKLLKRWLYPEDRGDIMDLTHETKSVLEKLRQ